LDHVDEVDDLRASALLGRRLKEKAVNQSVLLIGTAY
jgi:hypothetical protein